MIADPADEQEARHLKQVSRIKHVILQKYLPAWQRILGSRHTRICYFDCYAGPGVYEFQGQRVDGSPIIAIKAATAYVGESGLSGRNMTLVLIENDDKQRASLERELKSLQPYEPGLRVQVMAEDARDFVPNILRRVADLAPSFFMVDPYGHPLTIPTLNEILSRSHTEALINFMYYRINMDASNPRVQHHLDEMFGDDCWRQQSFLQQGGATREGGFLGYFTSRINAKYKLSFRIQFDPEDNVKGNRTKYYLVHASNHLKAVLLMKEVMWPLGDEEGLFDYSARKSDYFPLFSRSPSEEELRDLLLDRYTGTEIEFDVLRGETWQWPFIEKHYRAAVKRMKSEGLATIIPVTSKTDRGLKQRDRIRFLGKREAADG